jgi:cell migration-inducing and hyaluronan-binding protein
MTGGSTTVLAGTEIRAESETPQLSISLTEMDNGSWVIFELPGFTTASTGTKQDSLDALRTASSTSYYNGDGSLWVKVVSAGGAAGGGRGGRGGGTSIQVNR